MGTKQVFIRTPTGPVTSTDFLESIKAHFHDALTECSRQLVNSDRIDGFSSKQLDNGDWEILLDHEGKQTRFVLYASDVPEESGLFKMEEPKTAELVIVDQLGVKGQQGGIHPGYWSIQWYTNQLDPLVRQKFLSAIEAIKQNKPSRMYRRQTNGTYAIAIDDDGTPKELHIRCLAKWKA